MFDYWNRLRTAQALDFGMILQETKRLFDQCPDVLRIYQNGIRHVSVDESQDLDEFQHGMLWYFWPPAHAFFVGDLRQSIYGFRKARPDLLRRLVTDSSHDPTRSFEIIQLQHNFRSGSRIVTAANTLIAHNSDKLAEPMIAALGNESGGIESGHIQAFAGRYIDLVGRIEGLRGVYQDREIAVIARKHAILRNLQAQMIESNVPCQRVGRSADATQVVEFSKIRAMMGLVLNRRDAVAVTLLSAELGLSAETLARTNHLSASQRLPIFDAYLQIAPNQIGNIIGYASPHGPAMPFIDQVARLIHSEDPDHLNRAVEFWLEQSIDRTIAEALESIATFDNDKGDDRQDIDAVTLITAHAAKGLEWPVVFILGANEGLMPSAQSIKAAVSNDPEAIEEERRLAYVAVTRGARYVGLMHLVDENEPSDEQSRFIEESGLQCVTEDITNAASIF
ncbi:MAG: UvrD-helicase domain-containing protein [Planctomycetes bacterium]|nr:UvrD-helicase domain-containing protein [Planctomycetota bacterium]